MRRTGVALLVLLSVTLTCCAANESAEPGRQLHAEVLEELPHDPTAFTQGLELVGDTLYEGTGRLGQSAIRAIDPRTGAERAREDLPAEFFGEGITVVGTTIWQLTWQNEVALRRDLDTLAELDRVGYQGEGWGLCYQRGDQGAQDRLVMSDGSDTLTFRDPRTFQRIGEITVRGGTVGQLNELECVGEAVYANVFQTDRILRIDPASGQVTATIDLSGLREAFSSAELAEMDVLNGIAAIPDTDQFLVTGKLWPKMFRVRFVPAQ
ncbi:glutamine cyclotransferase [Tamaricihabitans halophyticus]|uniref:Glutamine cyclotransferase n=1 Tax=Tamaricihabitans halophyticus TaxID=1262583 RepID=A0A4R2R1J7_9PSEU|nr:glutaminyl-peptide cyclotransferase [Tamaricihabitans halophyticus]TCP56552.1 glutamine cyclotransferase [Tamaricihabitans halophyticus]